MIYDLSKVSEAALGSSEKVNQVSFYGTLKLHAHIVAVETQF